MAPESSKEAEANVLKFYETLGWVMEGDITGDARRFEDLREHSQDYVSKCRLRVLNHIPKDGDRILDMASGPIQFKEYLTYSLNFKKRYCIDLSPTALEGAKNKIGDHGVFLQGSFIDIPLEQNFFDCSISLHTIFHIDKDRQEDAVRKLLFVTKPEKPVIIVYSNPTPLVQSNVFRFISFPFRLLTTQIRLLKIVLTALRAQNKISFPLVLIMFPIECVKLLIYILLKKNKEPLPENNWSLYFYAHSLKWWTRFEDTANLEIAPWRSFTSYDQKRYIPNNKLGRKLFELLFYLEERFPLFFVNHFQYPMIILKKKHD